MMLFGWGVKAGMACLQVKLCVISERFGKRTLYLKALYKCPGLLYFLLTEFKAILRLLAGWRYASQHTVRH